MLASSVQGSIMGTSRMDNSYVVLSKKNRSKSLGVSQRPLSSASPHVEPNQPTRPMECSYIMLPPPTASIYKASSSEDAAQLLPPIVNSSSSSPQNSSGLFSSVTVLKRAFEIATSQAQVLLLDASMLIVQALLLLHSYFSACFCYSVIVFFCGSYLMITIMCRLSSHFAWNVCEFFLIKWTLRLKILILMSELMRLVFNLWIKNPTAS